MKDQILNALRQLLRLLSDGGEAEGALLISRILSLDYDTVEFWRETTGLAIWGGSGSLYDQAFSGQPSSENLTEFYRLLLRLNELLEESGHTNNFMQSSKLILQQLVR